MKKYQVTIYNLKNEYRPISAVVSAEEGMTDKQIKNKGIIAICAKRGWSIKDLAKYGYTAIKFREYNEKVSEAEKLIKKIANKRKYKDKKEG